MFYDKSVLCFYFVHYFVDFAFPIKARKQSGTLTSQLEISSVSSTFNEIELFNFLCCVLTLFLFILLSGNTSAIKVNALKKQCTRDQIASTKLNENIR